APLRLEAVVDAAAHQACLEARIGAEHRRAAAEIRIEIFNLGRPRPGDRRFDAAAQCPAESGVVGAADAGDVGLDVAERRAAGDERQEAVEGITEAGARRAQPIVARFADRARARCTTANTGPVDVAFESEHGLAHLPVVANRAAGQTAGDVVAARRQGSGNIRTAEAAAAVDTDIKAGPIIGCLIDRRFGRHRMPALYVRRVCRTHDCQHGESTKARHYRTLHY